MICWSKIGTSGFVLGLLCSTVLPAKSEPAQTGAGQSGGGAALSTPYREPIGDSGNPAATNVVLGTGWLGQQLGIDKHGIRLGGVWVGGGNYLLSGGIDPGLSGYSSLVIDLFVDLERFAGLKGSSIGADFAQINVDPINAQAGSELGYIGLVEAPPNNRSELSEIWWRQELFDQHLIVRVGKSNPTIDFQNIVRPFNPDPARSISAVTSLLFGPAAVLPMLYDLLPGFYDTAYGVTSTWVPNETFHLSYGVYDGNKARGVATGLTGPEFNGYYFHIAEAGTNWVLGEERKAGFLSVGGWTQTGKLMSANDLIKEDGAQGAYIIASQLLWYRDPLPVNDAGVSGYVQFGWTDSQTLSVDHFVGVGFTGRGLVPNRPKDTFGIGMALGWLNQDLFEQDMELVLQTFYQAQVTGAVRTETALSYIPQPAAQPGLDAAWAVTQQVIVPF
jgi:porin